MTARRPSVAIAGGGVFGAAAALELAGRGHAVTLVDPGDLPRPEASSTDTSKAVRADYGDDDGFTDLARRAIDGWRRWGEAWGRPVLVECGFAFLTVEPITPGSLEADSLARHRAAGLDPPRLDAREIVRRWPPFAHGAFVDGYLSPGSGFVDGAAVVAELLRRAAGAGATVRPRTAVAGVLERGRTVEGLALADGDTVRADVTVVAAGAWTPRLVPELADRIVATGQTVLYFRPRRPERFAPAAFPVWSGDIGRTGWYGFPATPDGLVKVGHHGIGRPADPEAPRAPDPAVATRAREFLVGTVPELAEAPLAGSRECLYADAWDGAFYVDAVPDRPGLVVAAGGSGHGFKFAPLLGPWIADVVAGRPGRRPARFRWRERGDDRVERARLTEPGSWPG